MDDQSRTNRKDRYAKRRSNRIQLISLIVLALLCLILLIYMVINKDKKEDTANSNEQINNEEVVHNETNNDENKSNNEANNNANENNDENKEDENEEEEKGVMDRDSFPNDIEKETLYTTDNNVEEAHVADWPAIGTNQEGAHTVDFSDSSEDRKEIKKAVSYVTDLNEDEMIEHWIGNGGEQKVVATVSDKDSNKIYRVYLDWEMEKGWKPTKVEKLKEVDVGGS